MGNKRIENEIAEQEEEEEEKTQNYFNYKGVFYERLAKYCRMYNTPLQLLIQTDFWSLQNPKRRLNSISNSTNEINLILVIISLFLVRYQRNWRVQCSVFTFSLSHSNSNFMHYFPCQL